MEKSHNILPKLQNFRKLEQLISRESKHKPELSSNWEYVVTQAPSKEVIMAEMEIMEGFVIMGCPLPNTAERPSCQHQKRTNASDTRPHLKGPGSHLEGIKYSALVSE